MTNKYKKNQEPDRIYDNKADKYPDMKCNQSIKCPCYKGDGYRYCFDNIEFLFCDICNYKLLRQMVEQKMIEIDLKEQGKQNDKS